MQKSAFIIVALVVLVLAGCTSQQQNTADNTQTTTSDLSSETADVANSVGQSFISETDEVQIGEMI